MKKSLLILVAVFCVGQLAFAGQPKLVKAWVEPEEAAIGDSVKLYVEFTGSAKDIKEVYLTVREYPYDYPRIDLQPMGTKKNLWFKEGEIPYDAYSETYHLDINAFTKKGKEIVTKGFEENSTGKAGTIVLKAK